MKEIEELKRAQASTDLLVGTLLAKIKAAEFAIASLIASHPEPNQAFAVWDRIHLDLSDETFDAGNLPRYQDQMATSLAMWSQGFRSAAQAAPKEPGSPPA